MRIAEDRIQVAASMAASRYGRSAPRCTAAIGTPARMPTTTRERRMRTLAWEDGMIMARSVALL
jgi:hypothetical protein